MMNKRLLSVVALLQVIVATYSVQATAETRKKLYFSFITAMSGESTDSSGGIPIIDFALEQINNNTDILTNYILNYTTVVDSKCKSISALEGFLSHFDNETGKEPTYVTEMCCGCSSATIPVAEISHHWNVPHISFASSTPVLNNRNRFKTFFRTLPCYVYVPPTIATIMKEFGWKQMAIITQEESPFNTATEGIQEIFDDQGWMLDQTSVIDPRNKNINYAELLEWEEDYRIIMFNTFEKHAYHLVCEAYKKYGQKLLDQRIVLILHGRYTEKWWEITDLSDSRCTKYEVMRALNKTLTLTPDTYDLMENTSAMAFSGITPLQFKQKYEELMELPKYQNYTPLNFYGNAYDAMWVVAVGLDTVDRWARENHTIDECEKIPNGELVTLDKFDYRNKKMSCYLREGFAAVNITGITGPIRFKPDGARPENVMRLRQHRIMKHPDGYSVMRPTTARVINEDNYNTGVVRYENNGRVEFVNGESYLTLWSAEVAPYDGRPIDAVDRIDVGLTVIYYVLGVVGLVFAAACLVFNIVFKNKRVVKLGSPNLNFLIIAGATLLYISVFFYSISVPSLAQQLEETILCNFRFWMFAIGNTLCFAVILAKQWRVYYIFSNPKPSKMIIKDWMLVIIVALLVLVEIIVMTIGTAVPNSRVIADPKLVNELRQNENGINERVFNFICTNRHSIIWISVTYGYKAVLQLGAIFMAFTTRKVNIKGLNDTKEVYIIIYINTIIVTVLIVTEFALKNHLIVYTVLYGAAILTEATLFLSMTFIPKAIMLHKDPTGKDVFTDSQHGTSQFTITINEPKGSNSMDMTTMTSSDIKTKIAELQKHLAYREKSEFNGSTAQSLDSE